MPSNQYRVLVFEHGLTDMSSEGVAEDSSVLLKDQKAQMDRSFVEQAEKPASCIEITDADYELILPSRRPVAEKELLKTLDLRLLPIIVLIFILNYIDVSNCYS